jgi:hypothetical protein
MTEASAAITELQIRCVHRFDADPLFEAARYTFSVEGPEHGFEVDVRLSPIFVTLLPLQQRADLQAVALEVVEGALAAGLEGAAVIRVTPDGTPEGGGLRLEPLLPLR